MMFPLSLTGEAKTWLNELNEGTIENWDELRTTFISRFIPPALFNRLLGEIRAFSQHENETLIDAWLCMKKILGNCHGHNLSKGNILKIFYHGLNEITQEALNVIAGVIFLYKTPNQAYQLLEDKVLLKLDWAKNQKSKSSLKKTVAFANEGTSNSDTNKIMDRMDAMTMKMDAKFADKQSALPSGSLPSNTQPNLKGSSSKPYQPPQARNEHADDEESTPQPKSQTPKPVKETPIPKPFKPKIPYPQRLRKEIPNYGKFLKELVSNKHKLEQISSTFLSDESSAIIQNKVPPKFGDPESFIIPCNFNKSFSCNALPKLVASINLIIDVIDEILEEDFDALLNERSKILHSIKGTILEEKLFVEFDEFMEMTADEEEPKFKKITFNTDYKFKTSLEEPPSNLELKPLPNNL
ncbi:reverse transcriptase domain-containing protein [Tanacetum coccineum]